MCFIIFYNSNAYADKDKLDNFELVLLELKDSFEEEISKTKNLDKINNLAIKTSASIWALIVYNQTNEIFWLDEIEKLEKFYNAKHSLSEKNYKALNLYYISCFKFAHLKTKKYSGNTFFLKQIEKAREKEFKNINNSKASEGTKNNNKSLVLLEIINIITVYINLIYEERYTENDMKQNLKQLAIEREFIINENKTHKEAKKLILNYTHLHNINQNLFMQVKLNNFHGSFIELENYLNERKNNNKEIPNFISISWVSNTQINFALAIIYAIN